MSWATLYANLHDIDVKEPLHMPGNIRYSIETTLPELESNDPATPPPSPAGSEVGTAKSMETRPLDLSAPPEVAKRKVKRDLFKTRAKLEAGLEPPIPIGVKGDTRWWWQRWIASQFHSINEHADTGYRHTFMIACSKFVPSTKSNFGSSHIQSANERTGARTLILDYCKKKRLIPYMFDLAESDIPRRDRNELIGCHSVHTTKDMCIPSIQDPTDSADIYVLIDSDGHRDDMTRLVCEKPCMMYTFMPDTVAAEEGDYYFSFDAHSRLSYIVNGGAVWPHRVWDWRVDGFAANYGPHLYHIKCEYRRVSPHHYFVFTVPVSYGLRKLNFLSTPPVFLKRFDVNVGSMLSTGNFNAMVRFIPRCGKEPSVRLMSIAGVGETQGITLPVEVYNSAHRNYIRGGCKAGTDADVVATDHYADDDPVWIKVYKPVLHAFLSELGTRRCAIVGTTTGAIAQPTTPDEKSAAQLYLGDSQVDTDFKKTSTILGPELIRGATVPIANEAAARACIAGRITEVKSDLIPTSVLDDYDPIFDDFMTHFPKDLHPISLEQVDRLMSKPTQRAAFKRYFATLQQTNKPSASFIKREVAKSGASDPRAISTLSAQNKIMFSAYTLPAAKVMKGFGWYAFGKTPKRISDRVHHVASGVDVKTITTSDYSRFDGTRSNGIAHFERRFLATLFASEHVQDVLSFFDAELDIKGYMCDVKYDIATARLSGSPDTSLLNSFTNAFVAYLALRKAGCVDAEAWKRLGIYGGDDGFSINMDKEMYVYVASSLGLRLKIEAHQDPSHPVTFLARTYYNPKNSPGSTADIIRVLGKAHISTAPVNIPSGAKYARKFDAITVMDAQTPILGALATSYKQCFSPDEMKADRKVAGHHSYWNEMVTKARTAGDSEKYPPYEDHGAIYAYLHEVTGIMPPDWIELEKTLKSTPFKDIKMLPLIDNFKEPKYRCIIGREFYCGTTGGTAPLPPAQSKVKTRNQPIRSDTTSNPQVANNDAASKAKQPPPTRTRRPLPPPEATRLRGGLNRNPTDPKAGLPVQQQPTS